MTVPGLYILKTLLMAQSKFDSIFNENIDHNYNMRFIKQFSVPFKIV